MEHKEPNIPVTILSGFLGAGKTTFLNHILQENPDTRYAIIENEFGEQGIDNELIITPDDSIVELNNGCLCCTLNDNLYDILNELYTRRHEFDEIIIEATGVADPSGLAQPFIAHPLVKRHFPLTSIICLVDAERVEDHIQDTEEAASQITFSDILLINKTDLVDDKYVESLEVSLRQMNPLASIVKGNKSSFPKIDYHRNNEDLQQTLLGSNNESSRETDALDFPINKPHHHHHHIHTKEINSITFEFDTPFDLQKLRLQLSVFLTFQSRDLYRMKGLVSLEGQEGQFILQSVGSRFDLTPKDFRKEEHAQSSILVFIGKNLKREGIERMLNNCLSKQMEMA